MENNDDDYFSDDLDFDSLPPGTLYELEQNAYQTTQNPTTQHYNAPLDPDIHTEFKAQAPPSVNLSAGLKPPPRLHSGLTNDFDSPEVGELEAEIHDNVGDSLAPPQNHHVMVADGEWPANGGIYDAMDLDHHAQGQSYELNARLEQVNRLKDWSPDGVNR